MNETERLIQYEICKQRGHKSTGVGLGEYSICRHCEVHYKWVLEENASTLPIGVGKNEQEKEST